VVAALDYDIETHTRARSSQAERQPNTAKVEWSQEPNLVAIREEVSLLKELLQEQLGELTWGDRKRRHPVQSALMRRLVNMGFTPQVAEQFTGRVNATDIDSGWQEVAMEIAHAMPAVSHSILDDGGVYSLVGPTGVGKTTTLAKLAAQYVIKHGQDSVGLVTTDSYRIAAHEQLRTYANIMNVPMRVADSADKLEDILTEFSDKKLVLIDTAGISQRDKRLAQQMNCLMNAGRQINTLLVLSATAQTSVLKQAVKTFGVIPISAVILTKLDETMSLGESLSTVIANQLKVAYITNGQRVPEDIAMAEPNELLRYATELEQQVQQDWITAMQRQLG
jgi:flagellar biosynthesis protein FlhF